MGMLAASAQPIPISVPNGSFESPATLYVSTFIDAWQENPKPADYAEGGGFTWDQLTGLFVNTAPTAADHIGNMDGKQAAYLFAVPGTGWFQDHDSVDWRNRPPTNAFAARYTVDHAYELSFGVVGGGGNMLEGVSFAASLYFRDAATNLVNIGVTNVAYSHATFPTADNGLPIRTNLTYFKLRIPPVKATDPWAGQYVGIHFLSTVSPEMQGGYWDVDDIRLADLPPPVLTITPAGTDLLLSWTSVNGFRYQVQLSEDLQTWSDYGAAQAGTDQALSLTVHGPAAPHASVSFRVRASPAP